MIDYEFTYDEAMCEEARQRESQLNAEGLPLPGRGVD